jgi:hypothetical protein
MASVVSWTLASAHISVPPSRALPNWRYLLGDGSVAEPREPLSRLARSHLSRQEPPLAIMFQWRAGQCRDRRKNCNSVWGREVTTVSADCFDAALAGAPILLMSRDGTVLPAAVARWHAAASGEDRWLLDRCIGPTVDLGCGPGRLVAALAIRGVPALGVDCARRAVRMCQSRGDAVLHRDLFTELPAEGRWHHVLLVDGNIGIAGDPVALLRRCAALVRPGGTLLVERHPTLTHRPPVYGVAWPGCTTSPTTHRPDRGFAGQ